MLPSTAKPVLKSFVQELGTTSLVSDVETGVDRMLPSPLERSKKLNRVVVVVGSSVKKNRDQTV